MDDHADHERKVQALLHKLAVEGVKNAVKGLSTMIGEELQMTQPEVSLISVLELPNLLGPETEAIGVFLAAEGDLAGQFMLIFPYAKALELVDLIMFETPGTTQELTSMEKSALAEAGNLTGAYFLNKVSEITGMTTVLSTPAVMADMVGAILNILVASNVEVAEHVMMIRTVIMQGEHHVQANFWFIPNPRTINTFAEKAIKLIGDQL